MKFQLVMLGYHVPKTADADYYPLQVLKNILFAGESSRLYQRLVDKDQLALLVNGEMQRSLDPTLFEIIC